MWASEPSKHPPKFPCSFNPRYQIPDQCRLLACTYPPNSQMVLTGPIVAPTLLLASRLRETFDWCMRLRRSWEVGTVRLRRLRRCAVKVKAQPRRASKDPNTTMGARSVREGASSRILTRCCCCRWLSGEVLVADACKRSRRGGLHATGRSAREGREGVRVVWWLVRVGCSIPRP